MAHKQSHAGRKQGTAGKWWQRRRPGKSRRVTARRGRFETLEPRHLLAVINVVPAPADTVLDNDFTRIDNAIQSALSGDSVVLDGTFDWTQTNAAASWAAADYAVWVPSGRNNITVTAVGGLGSATIQGPGDDPTLDVWYEGFLYFPGNNAGWEISDLEILDFDIAILMEGVANNTRIVDNYIRVPEDVLETSVPSEDVQNIAIFLAPGTNQVVSGNLIEFEGTGISDSGNSIYATSMGILSMTAGGATYEGLEISDNTFRVLGAQSADPERIMGVWENGHAHASNINIFGNTFENLDGANDPDVNRQVGFRITSHSSANTSVTYDNNTVDGANVGFAWLCCELGPDPDFSPYDPVVLTRNVVTDAEIGVLITSQGSAWLSDNTLSGIGTPESVGVKIEPGSTASIVGTVGPNTIDGFEVGVDVNGSLALIEDADLNGNTIGVLIRNGGMADLGDLSGADVTGLGTGSGPNGSSTGGNDFSSYTTTATTTEGAIVVLNVDNVAGPQGLGNGDIPAQGNVWADSSYAGIENVVYHDTDDPDVAFVLFAEQGAILGRFIFYNNSAWDGDAGASVADDAAIATDKTPLLPGGTATFANYTSYSGGINGIMIDIFDLPAAPTAADFQFRVGNNNTPSSWAAGPTPLLIATRPSPDFPGATRVTLIWEDYFTGVNPATTAAGKEWLEVRVLPTAQTGLAETDIFYVGNAIGESGLGNQATLAQVSAADRTAARQNPVDPINNPPGAAIDNPYDYNRDKAVDPVDEAIAQFNQTSLLTALRLISISDPPASPLPSPLLQGSAPKTTSTGSTQPLEPVTATVESQSDTSVWTTPDSSQGSGAIGGDTSKDQDTDGYAASVDMALESVLTEGLIRGRLLPKA